MLITPYAYQNASLLVQTGPSMDLSQEAAMGRHWKIVATVDPRVQPIMTKSVP